jgi:hypothetical protein
MIEISQERIQLFFERFPLLKQTIQILNRANIPFAIGGSGCLFILGNDRLPDDVDIYLPNDRHDEADALFQCVSYRYESAQENVRNSNPEGNHSIQLTSDLVLTIQGKRYDLALTQDVLDYRLESEFDGEKVAFYPPEDVLLIKALLQRGAEVGKHDIEDVEKFLKIFSHIRSAYLHERIRFLRAEERVHAIFQ